MNNPVISSGNQFQNKCFSPFSFKSGILHCENVEIGKIFAGNGKTCEFVDIANYNKTTTIDEPLTPAFVYSLSGIYKNVKSYVEGIRLAGISGKIGYAIKANPNIHLVEKMLEFGVEMIIAVSGYEVITALKAGFSPENILLNGNGKQPWEIKFAILHGVKMNVDSVFDAQRISKIHDELNNDREAQVFLRLRPNPPSDPHVQLSVHEYVNTAEKSKFGFSMSELPQVLEALNTTSTNGKINIIGIHCHFGSGIKNPKVYEWLGSTISEIKEELSKMGVFIQVINVGGGIGIDYFEKPAGFWDYVDDGFPAGRLDISEKVPSVYSFISALATTVPKNVEVILEPGRSLIGKAGILVCNVLGTKTSNGRNIMVVDGSMNEVIRPCLYGAHHEILPTQLNPQEQWTPYDIVGPICESSDFLGKHVPMQSGTRHVAVMDVGAYCSSMASVYNLKPRAAEILVDGSTWSHIRKRDTFQEIINKWE